MSTPVSAEIKNDIRDGLIAIIKGAHLGGTGGGNTADVFSAEVTAVDIATRSCSVTSISSEVEMDYETVWLMAQVADGVLYVPKIGSTVIVGNNSSLQPFVMAWTELDQIMYVVGESTYKMTDGLIQFNDGDNDGLVNVKPLVDKLNAIENLINNLKTAVTAVVIAGTVADGGAVKAGILAGLGAGITPITKKADLEDTKVTH